MHTDLEHCPLCGSELSQTKYREIKAKLREQEEKKASDFAELKASIQRATEQEFKDKLEQMRRAVEKKVQAQAEQDMQKALLEKQELESKLKAAHDHEAESQKQAQAEIEKQRNLAARKAKADSEAEVRKLTLERDQAATKLKQAEANQATIRKEAEQKAERTWQKELIAQRSAFEKDKNNALLKQQCDHNRDRELLQKKLNTVEQQLQKKTANELGDGGEIDVRETLREAFSGDRITQIPKGQPGADILHEILYRGDVCGRIIIESKNQQKWQNAWITKLRQDKVEAHAEHAVLATTIFPAGRHELYIESDVIVVSPRRVVYITELLRQSLVTMHIKGLSLKERSSKMTELYKLITSEAYSQKFAELERLTQDVLDLDAQEVQDHGIVWKKRGTLTTRLKRVLRDIGTDVSAVIERTEVRPKQFPTAEGGQRSLLSSLKPESLISGEFAGTEEN